MTRILRKILGKFLGHKEYFKFVIARDLYKSVNNFNSRGTVSVTSVYKRKSD
jgi:hypothetical protein